MPISNKKICISEKDEIYCKLTIIDELNNESNDQFEAEENFGLRHRPMVK